MTNRAIPAVVFSINILIMLYFWGSIPSSYLSQVPQVNLFFAWCLVSWGSLVFMSLWQCADEEKISQISKEPKKKNFNEKRKY